MRNQSYLNAFGKHLKGLIESRKTTPEQVAAVGGIETKQVYRIINGERNATIATILALAKGLEVQPKKLFDFDFPFEK